MFIFWSKAMTDIDRAVSKMQVNKTCSAKPRTSENKRTDYDYVHDIKDKLNKKTDRDFSDSNSAFCGKGGSNKRANFDLSRIKSIVTTHEFKSIKGKTSFDENSHRSIEHEVNENRSNVETKHAETRRRSSFPSSFADVFKHETIFFNRSTYVLGDQRKDNTLILGSKIITRKSKKDYCSLLDDKFLSVNKNVNTLLMPLEKKG